MSTASDADIMNAFTEFVEWQNYASAMLVECEVAGARDRVTGQVPGAQKMLQNWGSKDTVTKVRGEVSARP